MTTSPQGVVPEKHAAFEAVTPIPLRFEGQSEVLEHEEEATTVRWVTNQEDAPLHFEGQVRDPLRFREAVAMLYDVVRSSRRRAPKDRAAYLAHQRGRGGTNSEEAFGQQSAFFAAQGATQAQEDRWVVMPPTLSVHPDQLTLEVFSKDEGTYASLAIKTEAFDQKTPAKARWGSAQIDFSTALHDGLGRLRTWRPTTLVAGPGEATEATRHSQVDVPNAWLRGFLQVQAAATLTQASFTLGPVDLYNILRHLRLNADQKTGGRAMRAELIPGQMPRVVLEPWEEVFETTDRLYQGDLAQVFRIWGRRRLQMLRRMLPYLDTMEVHLLGSGMPSFYVLRCGAVTLTLGLTGFMATNWAASLGFDALLPRGQENEALKARAAALIAHLQTHWAASSSDLGAALGLSPADLRAAARLAIQQGEIMVDFGHQGYRLRSLPRAIDLGALVHRSPQIQQAQDLLEGRGGSVTLESVEQIVGVGMRVVATVAIEADQRSYRCQMTLDNEGRAKDIDDTSPFFQKHQLKEGPSVPLIALRLKIAQLAPRACPSPPWRAHRPDPHLRAPPRPRGGDRRTLL